MHAQQAPTARAMWSTVGFVTLLRYRVERNAPLTKSTAKLNSGIDSRVHGDGK